MNFFGSDKLLGWIISCAGVIPILVLLVNPVSIYFNTDAMGRPWRVATPKPATTNSTTHVSNVHRSEVEIRHKIGKTTKHSKQLLVTPQPTPERLKKSIYLNSRRHDESVM